MSWYNPLSWFAADPSNATTVALDPVPTPHIAAPTDAAISVLLLLHAEYGDSPLPADLREVSDRIHSKIPVSIRDDDTPSTRAEFALTIQRGALYLRAMKDWYDAP